VQQIAARQVVKGLRIDQGRLSLLRAKMLDRAEALKQRLYALHGSEFNLGKSGTTDKVTSILCDELGFLKTVSSAGRQTRITLGISAAARGEARPGEDQGDCL